MSTVLKNYQRYYVLGRCDTLGLGLGFKDSGFGFGASPMGFKKVGRRVNQRLLVGLPESIPREPNTPELRNIPSIIILRPYSLRYIPQLGVLGSLG